MGTGGEMTLSTNALCHRFRDHGAVQDFVSLADSTESVTQKLPNLTDLPGDRSGSA
jgi:hypothetical protein